MQSEISSSTWMKSRPVGLAMGSLGGLLILSASFLDWIPGDKTGMPAWPYDKPNKLVFILSLAILVGVVVTSLWKRYAAGPAFMIVTSSVVLYALVGGLNGMIEISQSEWATGFYLALIGTLLVLLSSLLLLTSRKEIVEEEATTSLQGSAVETEREDQV